MVAAVAYIYLSFNDTEHLPREENIKRVGPFRRGTSVTRVIKIIREESQFVCNLTRNNDRKEKRTVPRYPSK